MSDHLFVYGQAISFESKTVGTAAVSLTSANIDPTGLRVEGAMITCDTAAIRYRLDGSSPGTAAAGSGHYLGTASLLIIKGYNNLKKFRAVGDSGADNAVMQVTYYR